MTTPDGGEWRNRHDRPVADETVADAPTEQPRASGTSRRSSRRAPGSGPKLSGFATSKRPAVIAGVVVAGLAVALIAVAVGADANDGIVTTGADGQDYVIPANAERPEYRSREDCIADVTEQIEKLRREGTVVSDDPEQLCEDGSRYGSHYGAGHWVGPIIFPGSAWQSTRATGWSNVTSGGFAAPGAPVQADVVQRAASGAKVGERAPLKSGFGATGKSGFGSKVGG